MNYHIECSKCPHWLTLTLTHMPAWQSLAAAFRSVVSLKGFSGEANQINWSAFLNSETVSWLLLQLVIRFQHCPQTW